MSSRPSDTGKQPDTSGRPGQISVFRPGHQRLDAVITLDQRTGREIFRAPANFATPNPARIWASLSEITPSRALLSGNGLFPDSETTSPALYFDMLRTRVTQAMAQQGWRRLAVTSPGPGCGKSFVAANLALALARLPSCRTVLLDMQLRAPHLAALFGQSAAPPLLEFLMGEQPMEAQFCRYGSNLALGLNGMAVARAAETLQDPECAATLAAMQDLLQPDTVIFDTPPMLGSDDVLSLKGKVDAVLLVVDGTKTTPQQVTDCERLLVGQIPLLAVVLNRAQDAGLDRNLCGKA